MNFFIFWVSTSGRFPFFFFCARFFGLRATRLLWCMIYSTQRVYIYIPIIFLLLLLVNYLLFLIFFFFRLLVIILLPTLRFIFFILSFLFDASRILFFHILGGSVSLEVCFAKWMVRERNRQTEKNRWDCFYLLNKNAKTPRKSEQKLTFFFFI